MLSRGTSIAHQLEKIRQRRHTQWQLSTGTVSNEPYSVDSDEDEEPASKRLKSGSAAIPVVDLASDDDDNALSALAATYESGESQNSPERKDSGGNAVFSTPVHMNANAGASSSGLTPAGGGAVSRGGDARVAAAMASSSGLVPAGGGAVAAAVAGGGAPTMAADDGLNAGQREAMRQAIELGNSVKCVGGAGTGKTLVAEEFCERICWQDPSATLMWIAPYNSHVDGARPRVMGRPVVASALRYGRRMRTASSLFKLPFNRKPDPVVMAREISAKDKALLREPNLKIVIDEDDLLTPDRRDAIGEALKIVRSCAEPDGGVQMFEVGDLMQGKPYLIAAEKELDREAMQVGPRKELTIEGRHMQDPGRAIVFLSQTERFSELVYQQGSHAIRLGDTGRQAKELVRVARDRHVTEAENLEGINLYGTNTEVMERSWVAVPRRAAMRSAPGGVYTFVDHGAVAKYSEQELNELRTFGFEKQRFAIGEKMLLIVKGQLEAGESEDDDDYDDDYITGDSSNPQYGDGSWVTGNTPCVVDSWEEGEYVKVSVQRPGGQRCKIKVMLTARTKLVNGTLVTVQSFGLKPYQERVVDLAQGLEWDGLVHVHAEKIYGDGKFYVAITRAKSLANLKITGVPDNATLRRVVKSSWRGVSWLDKQGEQVPASSSRFAEGRLVQWERVWGKWFW